MYLKSLLVITGICILFTTTKVHAQQDGGCGCHSKIIIYNYGVVNSWVDLYMNNITTLSDYINLGDSVKFTSSASDFCYSSMTVTNNGDTLFTGNSSTVFTVHDTGHYHFRSVCDFFSVKNVDVYISYYAGTGFQEELSGKPFQLFPTVSRGVYHISTEQKLKLITINDHSGRMILSSTNNFSEIDITDFSPGIYFYAITDEKENIFRGRIVKE